MMEYVTGLIYNGTYSTKDKKMSKLIGKISNQRGKLFNNRIVEILNDIGEFQVYPNRKKINKKRAVTSKTDIPSIFPLPLSNHLFE